MYSGYISPPFHMSGLVPQVVEEMTRTRYAEAAGLSRAGEMKRTGGTCHQGDLAVGGVEARPTTRGSRHRRAVRDALVGRLKPAVLPYSACAKGGQPSRH